MEVDDIQMQGRKFQRIGNNGAGANKQLGHEKSNSHQYQEDNEELERNTNTADLIAGGAAARLCGWPTSRIVRVSRASGGKDRHSKVWTSKGLRDRRVRLSVTTAIQFYDLQDRLGYDQPSKAVEWLLKAAAGSIAELPSLEASFPDTPKQISNENSGDVVEFNQQNGGSLSKSGYSSTSETSKGSAGLSLSRSESRLKARERARERAAEKEKEKEKENEPLGVGVIHTQNHHNNNISQNSSFTELLNTGINPSPNNGTSQMDYLRSHNLPGWGNNLSPFNVTGDQNQFSFVQENLVPIVSSTAGGGGGGHYNLDFSVSSGLAGFNRGTLQSNTLSILPHNYHHHHHHHLQRFSPIDGSNIPSFFMAPNAVVMENHHHHHLYQSGIDGRLQPCYGDTASRHSDLKERGKI